mgnify:CR=1 FL=1
MNFDFTGFLFFVFGAVFGSFLNVCIHRFPRGESIVSPGSHCPHCSAPVHWFDNIPLVSYLFLIGRCRKCRAGISPRYFMVEMATALIWLFFYIFYGVTATSVVGIYLFTVLLAVTCTDFETGYIPDKFTLPSIVAGLVLSCIYPEIQDKTSWYMALLNSFGGFLIGGGILLVTGMIGNILFKKESMGGGDIKLLAMLGAFLGVKKIILVFLIAPIMALPLALYAKYYKRHETIPFGPFIAMAGAWMFLYGNRIWEQFFSIQ